MEPIWTPALNHLQNRKAPTILKFQDHHPDDWNTPQITWKRDAPPQRCDPDFVVNYPDLWQIARICGPDPACRDLPKLDEAPNMHEKESAL